VLTDRFRTGCDYADEDRPLRGYVALTSVYLGVSAALLRRAGRVSSVRISAGDIVLIGLASHRLSRTVTKEAIASPLRAPFTRYTRSGVASEVSEEVVADSTHHPYAHAVGELLTCPFCMAQWTSTGLVAAYILAPRQARVVTAILDSAAIANVLHLLYSSLTERVERQPD